MSFDSTGKSFITMMKGNTSFLFVNSILTVSFFGFGIQALANGISKIQTSGIEWEKGLVFVSLFLICMVGFIDSKDKDRNGFISVELLSAISIGIMIMLTLLLQHYSN